LQKKYLYEKKEFLNGGGLGSGFIAKIRQPCRPKKPLSGIIMVQEWERVILTLGKGEDIPLDRHPLKSV